jgi:ABC-2 type transport system permease protein
LSTNVANMKKGPPGSGSLVALYERRWLIWYLVQREVFSNYRGSFLGFFWAFLSPLLLIVLYTLVFSEIIGLRFREVEGNSALNFGVYLYCGLLPFLAFSDAVTQSVKSIRSNSTLVRKMVFPVEILPITTSVSAVADKLFGLGILILVIAALGYGIHWTLFLLPLLIAIQLVFTLGLSYLFAVAGTYVPDIEEALQSVVRASFFITPIIWPAERVPENLQFLVTYNPLAFLVGAYRDLILNGELPDAEHTFWFTLFSVALCVGAFVLFLKTKSKFADLL